MNDEAEELQLQIPGGTKIVHLSAANLLIAPQAGQYRINMGAPHPRGPSLHSVAHGVIGHHSRRQNCERLVG